MNVAKLSTPGYDNSPDFPSHSTIRGKENWSPGFTFENKNFSQQDHTTMTEWNAQVPIKIAESLNACRSELENMTGEWLYWLESPLSLCLSLNLAVNT